MMDIQCIALDVDGTLITDDHQLTPKTNELLRRLHQEGKVIVLCTGRGPVSALPLLAEMKIDSVLITHNGAVTLHSGTREILHQFDFPVAWIEPIVQYCREQQVHFDINTAFDMYAEQMRPEAEKMYEMYFANPIIRENSLEDVPSLVKFTAFGTREEMDALEGPLREIVANSEDLRMIRSGDLFIDIMHRNATKGRALAAFCANEGLNREQVAAFGNYYNDVEMLKFAGLGIAMDNSPDEVKAEADEVTLSNNEEGVYHYLMDRMFVHLKNDPPIPK
ncbi:Cof-type HAD-IIB family hydrolase [Marinicrinis sediminis]|uniref:Cof-type HAD-IIB family hydrolase n=1 Tax=Marinicrinis sediminis TaxID=1652465 RepID=A0ABW5RB45_9BACL